MSNQIFYNVGPDVIFSYKMPNGKTDNVRLVENIPVSLKKCLRITIGGCKYVVVPKYINEFSENNTANFLPREIIFNVGTKIKFDNDILVSLHEKFRVNLPAEFNIILPKGTLLQQEGTDLFIMLQKDKVIKVSEPVTQDKSTDEVAKKDTDGTTKPAIEKTTDEKIIDTSIKTHQPISLHCNCESCKKDHKKNDKVDDKTTDTFCKDDHVFIKDNPYYLRCKNCPKIINWLP